MVPQTPDPYALRDLLWPHVTFYQEQRDVIDSVWCNDETYVPAGNMLGKDFIAGFIVLAFFLSRMPCRIITTSIKADHLSVLWGEIHSFIQSSKVPLTIDRGGPLRVLQREIHREMDGGEKCYVKGIVSDKGEGMSGHHLERDIPRTLFVGDEVSGMQDNYYTMASAWASRMLFIGNCWPCENFFKHAIHGRPGTEDRGGDIPRENGEGYYRKIIRIKAEDSPNVRLGLEEQRNGLEPTDRVLVPGVLTFREYRKRRTLWDEVRQCVGLDAEFWMGADVLMFPPDWLNRAEQISEEAADNPALAIGCDPAEGGDKTAWAVIGERGIIELISVKTPDTTAVVSRTLSLMRLYNVPAEQVCFDRGGGGKEHADRLRRQGYKVQTVSFGEPPTNPMKQSKRWFSERVEEHEVRYAYHKRRAEMYGMLRLRLDPDEHPEGFGIPRKYSELRRQLSPIPLLYDEEGRIYLLPKRKKAATGPGSQVKTLIELLGCSPDESDALVIAVYAMDRKQYRPKVGVAF